MNLRFRHKFYLTNGQLVYYTVVIHYWLVIRLEIELEEVVVSEKELEETMSSRSLVLKNLAAGEYGEVKGQENTYFGTSPSQIRQIGEDHNHEADIESSESGDYSWGQKERLSSRDSWDETNLTNRNSGSDVSGRRLDSGSDSGINHSSSRNSSSSSNAWSTDGHSDDTADGIGDSGNYDSDELSNHKSRQKQDQTSGDASSINSTSDSALSSMISSETDSLNAPNVNIEDKFKTLTKKRAPNWRKNIQKSSLDQSRHHQPVLDKSRHHASMLDFKVFDSSSPDLSCDDDAFGSCEYVKKIRKHSKMFSPDVKILETSERIYRSASIRRSNLEADMKRLKRTQSLKTVETLV